MQIIALKICRVIVKETFRDYITYLQENRFRRDNLNKAESDNEDLRDFKTDTIRSKLKNMGLISYNCFNITLA